MTDQPASTAPAAAAHPLVKGRCPACNGSSLFLGSGGYVTCSRLDCPNPSTADQLLHGETPPQAALARITALAEEYPAGIDTALIHEALGGPTPGQAATSTTQQRLADWANSAIAWGTVPHVPKFTVHPVTPEMEAAATARAVQTAADSEKAAAFIATTGAPAEHCGHLAPATLLTTRPTECVLRPGHQGSHADDRGCRWWPISDQEQPGPA